MKIDFKMKIQKNFGVYVILIKAEAKQQKQQQLNTNRKNP